jgi:hypothetical protein
MTESRVLEMAVMFGTVNIAVIVWALTVHFWRDGHRR